MAVVDVDNGRSECLVLTRCPVDWCRADLTGATKTSHHFLNEHTPEDFGLSPLGAADGGEA